MTLISMILCQKLILRVRFSSRFILVFIVYFKRWYALNDTLGGVLSVIFRQL